MKNLFVKVFFFGSLIVLLLSSCKKEDSNLVPSCKIILPIHEQEIGRGEVVKITAEANDIDGSITKVRFYVNGAEIGSSSNYPYSQNWNTANENIGDCVISVVVNDNSGGSTSHKVTVVIVDGEAFGNFTDPRDGQIYTTVLIGSQRWFAENLNHETANSWCYDFSELNCNRYGRLYTWEAALTACPDGWHLPSDDEWKVLERELGMIETEVNRTGNRGTDEGDKMKYSYGWPPYGNGTNSSGFKGLPAGNYWGISGGGLFTGLEYYAYFYSSTVYKEALDFKTCWYRRLDYRNSLVYRGYFHSEDGISVRCLKDQ